MPDGLPLTLLGYRSLSALATPLAGALIKRRLKKGKEDPERIGERCGIASVERPHGPIIWIHGASVGEVLAVGDLVERLRADNLQVLLTSGTVTSADMIARRFPPDVIHQYVPLDAPRFVNQFLDHWQPSLALFVESDLWPNLVLSTAERRIPMMLVNARMSPRSFPRWEKARRTIGALLECFDLCLTQSRIDTERFTALGAPQVKTVGNLKLDIPAPPADDLNLRQLRATLSRRQVIAAASTHKGEEEVILDMHRRLSGHFPSLLSIVVPRHPQRGVAIARMMASAGMRVAVRSQDELPLPDTDIYVADTMGELGLIYRVAPVVFMGGSLVEHGGQNPIEAIKLGAAVLHGPHVFNFPEVYGELDAAKGTWQAESDEHLLKMLGHLLSNQTSRERMVDAAAQVVAQLGGALNHTMAALEPYLLQIRLEAGTARA